MKGGWVAISRQIMDSPDLRTPAERWAMVWMVMHAAYEPTTVRTAHGAIRLERGQLSYSTRYLADAWGMSEAAVRRFLGRLEKRRSTRREPDAERDAGQLVITLCNYEKFQAADAAVTHQPTHERRSSDANNNKKQETIPSPSEKDKGRGRDPAPPFREFWDQAREVWRGMGSPPGNKGEAERAWSALSWRQKWTAHLCLDDYARQIAGERQTFPDRQAKHVVRYLRHRVFAEWEHTIDFEERDDAATQDDDRAERETHATAEDRPADGGDLFRSDPELHETAGRPVPGPRQLGGERPRADEGVAGVVAAPRLEVASAGDGGGARGPWWRDAMDGGGEVAERRDRREPRRPPSALGGPGQPPAALHEPPVERGVEALLPTGWPADRVATLVRLWRNGMSAAEIAAEIGDVSRNAVIGKAHRLGLSGSAEAGPLKTGPWSAAEVTRLGKLRDAGLTAGQAAKAIRRTKSAVVAKARSLGGPWPERELWSAEEIAEIERLARLGRTAQQIGAAIKRDHKAVLHAVRQRWGALSNLQPRQAQVRTAVVQEQVKRRLAERPEPAPAAEVVPMDLPPTRTLMTVRHGECRAVIGDAAADDTAMCGRPVHTDTPSGEPSSYCLHHHRRFHRAELGPPPSVRPEMREGDPLRAAGGAA